MRKLSLASASLFSSATILCGALHADEAALIGCINKYKTLGISPDAALAKCDKNTLATCIQDLVGTNFIAYAISDVPEKTRSESRKKSSRSKSNRNFADASNSTRKKPASLLRSTGYLIDLGSDDNRWMEGKGWEDLGCLAHTDGPYKRQSDMQTRGLFRGPRSYEWFRQGWCKTNSIELSQPYGIEDAKNQCELEALGIKN